MAGESDAGSSRAGETDRISSLVALGGGHGLSASLRAGRIVADHVTAVVTVADDGGSSGRLRRELGILPPGDLRMALCALAADDDEHERLTRLFQHRYGGTGALAGHAVGNLVFAGLWELLGDPLEALEAVGSILGVTGRVLPMSPVALDIAAEVVGLEADPRVVRTIIGQVAVATTPGSVRRVRLIPSDPPAADGVVDAIERADAIILGPGSWFTSVIPNMLVPGIAAALARTSATKILILNLAPQPGETAGFSAEQHLHVLRQHAPEVDVDVVLVDPRMPLSGTEREHLDRAATGLGARVLTAEIAKTAADGTMRPVHDPVSLASALATVMSGTDA
ncbi:uridine diphosphate-N-acetylglucosamine-binding protein YvcK [Rhodococcus sp. IEGM 1408]|uniref:gluconeogenesis factor YvcK family protein n=1 Tax=Rhodococcus sp. IEGM 1408 TaxID=3082220 RepID=UPI00295578C3|nr:uridine diphosphate-N-acetylglucosamine-binding protein YvcK [Rhodococcus sp. IEGM 1408]MDV8000285.1 uridine diphosphate-N-acetylglucosamine-binding protein YvcK [Rhodococcus sp. IEGM 1408]